MKFEGRHSDAVKLLDIWDSDEFVYLKLRDLKTGRSYTISWNLTYKGDYHLWSLADFEYLMTLSKERDGTYYIKRLAAPRAKEIEAPPWIVRYLTMKRCYSVDKINVFVILSFFLQSLVNILHLISEILW